MQHCYLAESVISVSPYLHCGRMQALKPESVQPTCLYKRQAVLQAAERDAGSPTPNGVEELAEMIPDIKQHTSAARLFTPPNPLAEAYCTASPGS